MILYGFKCEFCGQEFDAAFDPDDEKIAHCPICNKEGDRVWGYSGFRIDWVNGGVHGDEINMGTGKFHKSARDREYWAESNGLRKIKDG